MDFDIKITASELDSPAIDEIIELERSLAAKTEDELADIKTPIFLNPIFYYTIAAGLGALVAWGIHEPFFSDALDENYAIPFISDYMLFGTVASLLGLAIGLVFGISNRNWKQALYCGCVGVGVGLVASIVTTIVADITFGIMLNIAAQFIAPDYDPNGTDLPTGIAFFILVCGRGLAWSIIGLGAGLGLGVALKSKKLIFNGLVGGMIGGLLGGFLFDPIDRFITTGPSAEAAVSRCVGILSVGLLTGFFIGLIENISKEAWFLMQRGPLMGKQFVLFKNLTVIGSSPKADIYLFKDADIDPRHGVVTKHGNKYIIKDEGSRHGIFVNGRKIESYILQNGDILSMGETVLKFMEKADS